MRLRLIIIGEHCMHTIYFGKMKQSLRVKIETIRKRCIFGIFGQILKVFNLLAWIYKNPYGVPARLEEACLDLLVSFVVDPSPTCVLHVRFLSSVVTVFVIDLSQSYSFVTVLRLQNSIPQPVTGDPED